MARVIGMHEVQLPAGVTPEEYEQQFGNELATLPDHPGWKTYLLKGDRGDRAGQYLLLFEIESVEARAQIFPRPDEVSEEYGRFREQHPESTAVWDKYAGGLADPHGTTDYVVIGGPPS